MKRLVFLAILTVLISMQPLRLANSAPQDPLNPGVSLGITHGAHIRPVVEYGQEIKNFNSLVRKDIGVVMYFLDWSELSYDPGTGKFLDPWLLNRIKAAFGSNGPAIMITWQPMNGRATLGGKPACSKNYYGAIPLNDLIAGSCDNYIRGFAQALKERPERFILRFAHEMNITDSAWWPGHYGQDASQYVAMYRHVHDIFESQGVNNAEWMWSPNYASNPPDPWNELYNYYPGDAYVDWIGLSGYNWNRGDVPWRSFTWLYDSVLDNLACRYAKPQIIAEIGSVEGGGNQTKANWISDAYLQAPKYPFLRAMVWFNDYAYADPSSSDFRVTSNTGSDGGVFPVPPGSGAWTEAYRQAISSDAYTTRLPALLEATPPRIYCGGSAGVTMNPGSKMVKPGESANFTVEAMALSTDQNLSLIVPGSVGLQGSVSPQTLTAPWGSATVLIQTSGSTPTGTYNLTLQAGETDVPFQLTVSKTIVRIYLPDIHHE